MNNVTQASSSDEIDLVGFFQTLWDGKFKISAAIVIFVFGVLSFFLTQPAPSYIATTEIKPITSDVANRYGISNSVGFFNVYADEKSLRLGIERLDKDKDRDKDKDNNKAVMRVLDEVFLEQLGTRLLFEDAFRKHDILDKNDYETERDFGDAISKLAAEVRLKPPLEAEGESRRYWTVEFEFNDEEKWLNVLADVKAKANLNARALVKASFATTLTAAQKKKAFKIEDTSTMIDNALNDYHRTASDRLAFLREQAAIARKLGVAKNTIEAQAYSGRNGVVTNLTVDTPFYLRGYEAIEKEIAIVEARENKTAFIENLLELEQRKRQLEQDKTLERAEALFAETPVMSGDNFSAAVMAVAATKFERKSKRVLMLAMAFVLGGMVGSVYVLITNAVRKRNEKLA